MRQSETRQPSQTDLFRVLRVCPDYRRLFLARNASLLGDWFNLLAVLAVLRELGAFTAGSVGTIIILKLLPVTLAGPAAGVVADRFSRKAIMLIADATRFFLVLGIFLAPALGAGGVWLIYTLTFAQITAQAFSEPARVASVPNVVPTALLGTANALGALTWSLMFTLGAAAGGLVTSLLGWKLAIAFDAGSYLVSLAFLAGLHLPPPRVPARDDEKGLLTFLGIRDLLAAGRHLAGHPRILSFMTAKTGWGLAGGISMMLALFGERVYPVGGSADMGIALLYMARGIGTAIGPVISRRLTREESGALRIAIGVSFLLGGICYIIFSKASYAPLALLLVVIAHLGGSTVWVFSTLLLQKEVPDHYRGRVFAAELGMATAAISLSTWGWGWLLDHGWTNLRQMSMGIGVTMLLAACIWYSSQRLARPGARGRRSVEH